ncbi:hypothetical protein CBI30_08950 [Polynucleobacter aenigmaticus]|uniref:Uncharacterized protein n=1 Tax=Polynucleobacter aenigmaticus TaxID=1743164 RepID=A0A254PVK3_9BURK|nr:hypothetical protein CBI30_08950 [Polynucleobacter aenigmaticus]
MGGMAFQSLGKRSSRYKPFFNSANIFLMLEHTFCLPSSTFFSAAESGIDQMQNASGQLLVR